MSNIIAPTILNLASKILGNHSKTSDTSILALHFHCWHAFFFFYLLYSEPSGLNFLAFGTKPFPEIFCRIRYNSEEEGDKGTEF